MVYKVDHRDGDVYAWTATEDGASYECDTDYTPTCYVASAASDEDAIRDALGELEPHLATLPGVVDTGIERWRPGWRADAEPILRYDLATIDDVDDVAHQVREWGDPAEYTLYNVDFAREFRYCLETGLDPVPETSLEMLALTLPAKALNDEDITELRVAAELGDDASVAGLDGTADDEAAVLDALAATLAERDPDVLVLSAGDLVPLLYEKADRYDRPDFELGRLPGWQELATESSFESYGKVMHSPSRYNVFGRAIVDLSNSFFMSQTNLDGLLDLVERSRKPLQETSWASIGNVLTSIQIHEAMANDVLVPWNSWRHEQFKPLSTLHEADRGGFIFSPEVGFHENVHELDFSSLYPKIMVTRNISPDTIRCDCHADRSDVPGLGYSICDEDGYLKDVLGPILDDRDEYKAELDIVEDEYRREALQGRSSALKWILVSCFGYQGFSNAKFGRIECHEAINAFAREIILDTKEHLEAHGWRVIHGIVDSVWVQAMDDAEQTPLPEVAEEITADIGIELEYEAAYDWIAFVPRADSDEGALNRYFGKVAAENYTEGDEAGEDEGTEEGPDESGDSDDAEFKKRGIELRQRSTPPYIEDRQAAWLETLDEHREPAPVCEQLRLDLAELRAGDVDPHALRIRRRVSQPLAEYSQYTRNVAALERADVHDFEVAPGEDVEYVVVDDDKESAARVQLAYESIERYDEEFYADLLIRAAESVVSPFGWDRRRIRQYLSDTKDAAITMY